MKSYKIAIAAVSAVMLIGFSGCQTTQAASQQAETITITAAAATAAETALSAASTSYTERDLDGPMTKARRRRSISL
jgi:heme O synthase-like polyprenyltransferase